MSLKRSNYSRIWDYFDKDETGNKRATCRVCDSMFSYKSTTGNLTAHLHKKHVDVYRKLTQERVTSSYCINDRVKREPSKQKDSDDEDSNDEEGVDEDALASPGDQVYTETVYLEDSEKAENTYTTKTAKKRRKTLEVPKKVNRYSDSPKRVKRPRLNSNSSGDRPIYVIRTDKKAKAEVDESNKQDREDDIDIFGKYIMTLLRMVPKEICTKLQMDIVSLIMSAKYEHEISKKKEKEMITNYSINIRNADSLAQNNANCFQLQPSGSSANGVQYEYVLTSNGATEANEVVENNAKNCVKTIAMPAKINDVGLPNVNVISE